MANHTILHPELHNPDWLRTQAAEHTDAQIAADLGCSRTRVKQLRHAHGILSPKANTPTTTRLDRQPERYAPETEVRPTIQIIATCIACHWTTTLYATHQHGWHLEPDQKIRLTNGRLTHTPCGGSIRLFRSPKANRPMQLLPPWKGDNTTR